MTKCTMFFYKIYSLSFHAPSGLLVAMLDEGYLQTWRCDPCIPFLAPLAASYADARERLAASNEIRLQMEAERPVTVISVQGDGSSRTVTLSNVIAHLELEGAL